MTQISRPGGDCRFALIRLVLIDSYAEGCIIELPLAGGTAITGRNGRGKTSLLQLIPAFYGERPDRIVRPVSNKKSFARYYLPRSTSYAVYEYQRDDVTCCAILFADETGDAVHYRFLRSAYHKDLFVLEDGRSIVPSHALSERVKVKGATLSRKMPLDEYRAIIQGKIGHGSDRAKQRQMIADFSFCPSSHPLPHIERIVSGMFQRRTNFTDLQRMVVTSLPGGGKQIALGAERKKIESWPDIFDSYTAVMAESERMAGVQTAYDTLLAAEHELRCIHARFALLQTHQDAAKTLLTDEQRRARLHLQSSEQTYLEAARGRSDARKDIERQMTFCSEEIARLDREQKGFETQDVGAKAQLLEQEPAITAALGHDKARYALLVGQQTDIDLRFRELLSDLERQHLIALPTFSGDRERIHTAHRAQLLELGHQHAQRQSALRSAAQPLIDAAQQAVDQSSEAVGAAKANLANPQPDPALVRELERMGTDLSAARTRWQASITTADTARQGYERAQATYATAELQLNALLQEEKRLRGEIDALRLRETPGEASVLYALRTQRPDWTSDIAKVLREDLLVRTDLAPIIGPLQDSIFGLHLDLEQIDAPLAADEDALRAEIAGQEEAFQLLAGRIEAQRIVLDQAGESRRTADQDKELKGRERAAAEAATISLQTLEKSARQAINSSREAARDAADKAMQAADQHAKQTRAALAKVHEQLAHSLLVDTTTHAAAVASADQESARQVVGVDNREKAAQTTYQQKRKEIEDDRTQALKEKGVDTTTLTAIEKAVRIAESHLLTITASRNLVAEWRIWLSSQWSARPKLVGAIEGHTTALGCKNREIEAADLKWAEEKEAQQRAIRKRDEQLLDLSAEQERITTRRRMLEPYAADSDTLALPYDPAWTISALAAQANTQLRVSKENEDALGADVRAIKAVFVARRETPPDHFYDTHRQQMGPDRAEHAREWVPVFKSWYATEHEIYRNLLRVEARTIAEAVADFHGRMSRFHRDVAQFNRSLQESLNANLGFESISNVTVEIVSAIRELEYWGTIEKVAESRVAWMGREASAMPPPEFAVALRDLLDHWQIKEGIRADLTNLIRIQGEVVENGTRRPFKKAEDLETISSHGLSYIVLVLIFIGFINRVRGTASVNVVWALDEIKDLDVGNVELLLEILARNNITLVSACPDPDPDVLALFRNRCSIRADRRIYDAAGAGRTTEPTAPHEEAANV